MTLITVYSLDNCPNCEILKETLGYLGVEFVERNLQDKNSIIELRYHACFPKEAPVLQMSTGRIWESKEIFHDGAILEEVLNEVLTVTGG